MRPPSRPVEYRDCEIIQTHHVESFEMGAHKRDILKEDLQHYRRREEEHAMSRLLHREGLVKRDTWQDYHTCQTHYRTSMVVVKDPEVRDAAVAMWDAHKDAGRHEVIAMLIEEIARYDRHEVPFGPTIAASLRVILQRVRQQSAEMFTRASEPLHRRFEDPAQSPL